MKDWNQFMMTWDNYHRTILIPFMKTANKEQRRYANDLLSDLKSSLKWCRFEDCVKIYENMLNNITSNFDN